MLPQQYHLEIRNSYYTLSLKAESIINLNPPWNVGHNAALKMSYVFTILLLNCCT